MRMVSNIVTYLLAILITMAALSIAFGIAYGYIKSYNPSGAAIDVKLNVDVKSSPFSDVSTIIATLYVTCVGTDCDRYSIQSIRVYYVDSNGSSVRICEDPNEYPLSTYTRIPLVGYVKNVDSVRDIYVVFLLCDPSGCEQRAISKSLR